MVAVAVVTPTAVYTEPVSPAQSCGASVVTGAVVEMVGAENFEISASPV